MALVCAISGEVPEQPVVSPVSGAVFERRLIEKHLASSDEDPVTGQPLTADMLIAVTAPKTVRPRAPNATSIPTLLRTLQDEWDACMLESYKLRQHVETVRQELTHALYQHDAACRVIARLTKERDQAREALSSLQSVSRDSGAAGAAAEGMDVDETAAAVAPLPADVAAKMDEKYAALSKSRRKREKSAELASPDDIAAFTAQVDNSGLHTASSPGIVAMAVNPTDDSIIATAGRDKKICIFDRQAGKVSATCKGHTKPPTDLEFHPTGNFLASSSTDSTVRIWEASSGSKLQSFKPHSAGVTGISVHPCGDYVLSTSSDNSWALSNIETGDVYANVTDSAVSKGFTCVNFHPDGMLFGAGSTDGMLRMWHAKDQKNLASFDDHQGPVTSVAFSENGYYVATAAEDSTIKLWDLRKLKSIRSIDLAQGAVAHSLHFDHSGSYLAAAVDNTVQLYQTKGWANFHTISECSNTITSVRFGTNARMLATASMDRTLKIYA
eukprot:m.292335 g.292335  ORF g.292335 m.292335 type:complete len:498 (+) comp12612_c0_seq1:33-1526(+)